MAEDNRAVAESSASRNLQGGMELHVCCSRLQLGPYAESGDSNDISRDRSVFASPKNDSRATSRVNQNSSLSHTIAEPRENLNRIIPFFRSLLVIEVLEAQEIKETGSARN